MSSESRVSLTQVTAIVSTVTTATLIALLWRLKEQKRVYEERAKAADRLLTESQLVNRSLKAQIRELEHANQLTPLGTPANRDASQHGLVLASNTLASSSSKKSSEDQEERVIRIWMDGAFDMMHYGHMNAFRQGRALGTYLIAGINSDESIKACKGPPVCSERERIDTVKGCRFVDEVVEGVPYVMNEEYLRYVIEKYNIDYVVHGDDPCIVDGKNVYETAVNMGKYLTIPRTEGISTTDIVGRMLLMTRAHHEKPVEKDEGYDSDTSVGSASLAKALHSNEGALSRKSQFLTTSRTIRLFGANVKAPTENQRIVYIAGAWDMFHAGHIETLEKCKQHGDYLIVGVHNDYEVNKRYGMNLPILSLHERTLSVLGCKWVDDVLIDAPYHVTADMIASLKIDVVIQATSAKEMLRSASKVNLYEGVEGVVNEESEDPYTVPSSMGILEKVYIQYNLSALDFVERIQNQRERFSARFSVKKELEREFYKTKYHHL